MPTATFLVAIVLAVAAGAALGILLATRRTGPKVDPTRPLADAIQRI